MIPELEAVTFRRTHPPAGYQVPVHEKQQWEFVAPDGYAFARATLHPAEIQWRVDLEDRSPKIDDSDLVKLVGRLLVWQVGCPADAVEVVLVSRRRPNPPRQVLVKAGAEYI